MVVDTLCQKSGGSLATLITHQFRLLRDLEEMQVEVLIVDSSSIMSQLNQVSVNSSCMIKSKRPKKKTLK